MKNTLSILLVVALMALTSATTVKIMEVKPTVPEQVEVRVFNGPMTYKEIQRFIHTRTKDGWVVKSVSTSFYGQQISHQEGIVVMEKY
jgi:hypothetical protein